MSQSLNFPAEWAPQDGVLLAWPPAGSDWQPYLAQIERVYLDFIFHITRFEQVVLLCNTPDLAAAIPPKLASRGIDSERIRLLELPYNDTWLRDSGPLTILDDGQLYQYDFRFNGWGGKFDAQLDDAICQALWQQAVFRSGYRRFDLFLEGGSLESDGEGTLLTTRQCLLTETRNPAMQIADYERFFADVFGTKRVIWLSHGELQGDDTDGHVDMLARFCDPQTIAYTSCDRQDDAHFASLNALAKELADLRTLDGEPYILIPLPIPEPIYGAEDNRLPASYANFLIINDAVLVPCYADKNDALALARLRECFPGREVIGIDARAVIQQFGSLHCLSMQLPRGVLVHA